MNSSGVRYVQLRLRVPTSNGLTEVDAHCEVFRDDTKFISVVVAIAVPTAVGSAETDWDRQNVHVRHQHVDEAATMTPWRQEDAHDSISHL